ncbi:MAG: hypothetical protein EG822_08090 [Deltaproteobacteria bacterium]|nr:hypothetical protein [Deltaproteobacteria bacterium]TLN03371.1 MAG: hypothetical protein FDZ73_08070 [bacterium]
MTQISAYLKPWRTLAVVMLCCVFSAPAATGAPRSTLANQSVEKQPLPQRTLALYTKDPVTWKIRPGGAQGTLTYNEKTGQFSFAARKLKPLRGYVMVRNSGTPPTGDLLAQGTTNKAGELRLSGSWHDWTGKIWLVSGNDLTISGTRVTLIAWHPGQYLFEEKVLGVHCGDCDNK